MELSVVRLVNNYMIHHLIEVLGAGQFSLNAEQLAALLIDGHRLGSILSHALHQQMATREQSSPSLLTICLF